MTCTIEPHSDRRYAVTCDFHLSYKFATIHFDPFENSLLSGVPFSFINWFLPLMVLDGEHANFTYEMLLGLSYGIRYQQLNKTNGRYAMILNLVECKIIQLIKTSSRYFIDLDETDSYEGKHKILHFP